MYINYWKNIFNYNDSSKFSHFLMNMLINIVILFIIILSGFIVPYEWENTVVNIYYFVLFIMILPTISMIVRVFKNKKTI